MLKWRQNSRALAGVRVHARMRTANKFILELYESHEKITESDPHSQIVATPNVAKEKKTEPIVCEQNRNWCSIHTVCALCMVHRQ